VSGVGVREFGAGAEEKDKKPLQGIKLSAFMEDTGGSG